MTDHLLPQLRSNDSKAQYEFYKKYSARLFNVTYCYISNEQDAESVVNIGFYKIFSNIGKFVYSNEASMVAWMKKIVINEALAFIRQNSNFTELNDELTETMIVNIQTDANLSYNDYLEHIHNLPADLRTVFNLYAIDGYAHREIAEKLNIKESSSRVYLTRARKMLQKFLTKN